MQNAVELCCVQLPGSAGRQRDDGDVSTAGHEQSECQLSRAAEADGGQLPQQVCCCRV